MSKAHDRIDDLYARMRRKTSPKAIRRLRRVVDRLRRIAPPRSYRIPLKRGFQKARDTENT